MNLASEDVEMMETEDNSLTDNIFGHRFDKTTVSTNKRNFSDMNQSFDYNLENVLSSRSPKTLSIESRKILNAKRTKTKGTQFKHRKHFNQSIRQTDHNKMVCVLDTNILLSNLSELKNIIINEEKIAKRDSNQTEIESIIVPWIVVQELDHLKNRKNGIKSKFSDITNAIIFINEQLKSDGLVKGEKQTKSKTIETDGDCAFVGEQINDDKIINCCLRFKPSQYVVLISNDINLRNKAFISDIKAMNWSEFYEQYSESNKHFECDFDIEEERQSKRFAKSSSNSKTRDISVPARFSLNPKFSFTKKTASEVFDTSLHSKADTPLEACSTKSSLSKSSSPKRKNSITRNSPKSTKSIDNDSKKKSPLKYDDWIRYRYECEQQLMRFIVAVYQNIWQNEWKLMLEINRENATLKDMIRLIRKEWFSNFSDIFNRDSSIKSIVDNLHKNLKSETNFQLLYNDLREFMAIIEEKQIFSETSDRNSFKKLKTI